MPTPTAPGLFVYTDPIGSSSSDVEMANLEALIAPNTKSKVSK